MIRIARKEDINQIMNIVKETVEDLQNEGDYQWSESYPAREHFLNDIRHNDLYIYELNNEVSGFICLNKKEDEAYKPLKWQQSGEAIVIHRFAVKRSYQRRKIGTKLIQFVEQFAKNKGINYVKVDTNSQNTKMNALFQHLGFKFVGSIILRNLNDPFYCYDKTL